MGRKQFDGFVNIDVGPDNLDRWIARKGILEALGRALPLLHGSLLDIGCGKMPYRREILKNSKVSSYTGLDLEDALVYDPDIHPDVVWDGSEIPLPDRSFDCAIATEVLEHVTDIDLLLREIHRILIPGGVFFFTTPFIWPYHETPHDCQRWTALGLQSHLRAAGFHDDSIVSQGNWYSSLAQMIGLWGARAPMPRIFRTAIRYPLFLLQRILIRFDGDSLPVENSMPRCICGTARS